MRTQYKLELKSKLKEIAECEIGVKDARELQVSLLRKDAEQGFLVLDLYFEDWRKAQEVKTYIIEAKKAVIAREKK